MSKAMRGMLTAMVLAVGTSSGAAASDQERPFASRALLTTVALIANVTPVVSTVYAPQCLPGYVFCKVLFAGICTLAAVDQLVLSGGSDSAQTRAILHRGFGGDWVLTPRHISGEATPEPLPEPPPPTGDGEGGWEPPPL